MTKDLADELERLTRPIIGLENRTPLEVFDMMCDRIRLSALRGEQWQGIETLRNALLAERAWHDLRADLAFDAARECSTRGEGVAERDLMTAYSEHSHRIEAINTAIASCPPPPPPPKGQTDE